MIWNAENCTKAGSNKYPIFFGCSKLSSITIGENVKTIPAYAFKSGITSITIPDSVTSIGSYAFEGCRRLTSIIISDGVTSIGYQAFCGCSELKNIYITDLTAWCNISGLDNLMEYSSITKNFYLNNELVTNLTIPDGVTSISRSAFEGCSSLTSVTIGNGVTSIGERAFYKCSELKNIYITDLTAWCNISGLYNLMANSSAKNFYLNNELVTNLTIPDGVTSIDDWAFRGCSSLTSITIPDSVTSIGGRAFRGCSRLTSITISDGVTFIGGYAFDDCSSLKTVFYKGTAAQWGKISIGSDNGYLTSATKIYNYDDIIRNYSFVTNCEQTIEPISAKYIETLPVITRNDYYFGGWYDNAELNGTPINAPYYSKEKTTLYAKWWTEEEWNELHNGTSFDKAFIAESGKSYIVNITSGEQVVYFAFTATESKSYTIQSTGSCDTYGTLYSSSKSSLSTDDDSGSGSNFSITYSMSAGNTYYVAVNFFYGSSTTGSFTVRFS